MINKMNSSYVNTGGRNGNKLNDRKHIKVSATTSDYSRASKNQELFVKRKKSLQPTSSTKAMVAFNNFLLTQNTAKEYAYGAS